MRRPRTWWLAAGIWVFTAACAIATAVLIAVTAHPDPMLDWPSTIAAFVAFQSFATVGALIASRRPENAIGWIFCGAAALCQLANLAGAYSYFADERGLPGVVWSNVLFSPVWGTGVEMVALLGVLLFPDGRAPSPGWRWVVRLGIGVVAVGTVSAILSPGQVEGVPRSAVNPIGVAGMNFVSGVMWACALVLLLASIVALVTRFRRSRGAERQQLKVFVSTVCFVVVSIVCIALLHENSSVLDFLGSTIISVLWLLMLALIPCSVGVAILRYRLYEIDRVISRTLVYGSLTVLLGGAYAGLVLAGQALFSSFAGGSNLAIAASTLVVAALFLPLRSRVQSLVDRRFYRRRYDAQRTLEGFGARLREQVELEALEDDLVAVVGATMQPAHVSLWLREALR